MSHAPGDSSKPDDNLIALQRMTSEQFSLLNDNIPTTPNSFRHSGPTAPLTLKEQEKVRTGHVVAFILFFM